jgi:gamma-glutamyltranspeptidase / glutathione hydrolase
MLRGSPMPGSRRSRTRVRFLAFLVLWGGASFARIPVSSTRGPRLWRRLTAFLRIVAARPALGRPHHLPMTNRLPAATLSVLVVLGVAGAWHLERSGVTSTQEFSTVLPAIGDVDVISVMIDATHRQYIANVDWAVAGQHPDGVRVAGQVLQDGGNAVDAAVAAAFATSVAAPYGSGIGGGGVLLIAPHDGEPAVLDYLAAAGEARGGQQTAVPGFVPGLHEAHRVHGDLSWRELLAPSVQLAGEGTRLTGADVERILNSGRLRSTDPLLAGPSHAGASLTQPDLAETLRKIRDDPTTATTGALARRIAAEAGAGVTMRDLEAYEPVWRDPLTIDLPHGELVTAPPPAGGLLFAAAAGAVPRTGAIEDAASADEFARRWREIDQLRIEGIGDPDYVDVDVAAVLAPTDAEVRPTGDADLDLATSDTTHLAVLDGQGTLVSMTNTLSEFFGTGQRVEGFYLNNSLDNFGGSSSQANQWEPGKRPRTFLAPSVLTSTDGSRVAIGSAGGRRIPTALAQVLASAGTQPDGTTWRRAVRAPRLHPEGGVIALEPETPVDLTALRQRGYHVGTVPHGYFFGGVQLAGTGSDGSAFAVSDPRRGGAVVGGLLTEP